MHKQARPLTPRRPAKVGWKNSLTLGHVDGEYQRMSLFPVKHVAIMGVGGPRATAYCKFGLFVAASNGDVISFPVLCEEL